MSKEDQILLGFDHHAPNPDQVDRITQNRQAFKATARIVLSTCLESADRTVALRKLHEAMMIANKSIACERDG